MMDFRDFFRVREFLNFFFAELLFTIQTTFLLKKFIPKLYLANLLGDPNLYCPVPYGISFSAVWIEKALPEISDNENGNG